MLDQSIIKRLDETLLNYYFKHLLTKQFMKFKDKIHKFADLTENKIYFVCHKYLYLDDNLVLWCRDDFTHSCETNMMCDDHRVPVKKINDRLYYIMMPDDVKLVVGGDGDMTHDTESGENRVKIWNLVSGFNVAYRAEDLPEGESGWMLSWGLWKGIDNVYYIHPKYSINLIYHYCNHGLYVSKINGVYYVSQETFDQQKQEYHYETPRHEYPFCDTSREHIRVYIN